MTEIMEGVTFPSTLAGAAEERMLRRSGTGDRGASGKGREHAIYRASSSRSQDDRRWLRIGG